MKSSNLPFPLLLVCIDCDVRMHGCMHVFVCCELCMCMCGVQAHAEAEAQSHVVSGGSTTCRYGARMNMKHCSAMLTHLTQLLVRSAKAAQQQTQTQTQTQPGKRIPHLDPAARPSSHSPAPGQQAAGPAAAEALDAQRARQLSNYAASTSARLATLSHQAPGPLPPGGSRNAGGAARSADEAQRGGIASWPAPMLAGAAQLGVPPSSQPAHPPPSPHLPVQHWQPSQLPGHGHAPLVDGKLSSAPPAPHLPPPAAVAAGLAVGASSAGTWAWAGHTQGAGGNWAPVGAQVASHMAPAAAQGAWAGSSTPLPAVEEEGHTTAPRHAPSAAQAVPAVTAAAGGGWGLQGEPAGRAEGISWAGSSAEGVGALVSIPLPAGAARLLDALLATMQVCTRMQRQVGAADSPRTCLCEASYVCVYVHVCARVGVHVCMCRWFLGGVEEGGDGCVCLCAHVRKLSFAEGPQAGVCNGVKM